MTPADAWRHWSFQPVVLTGLGVSAWAYWRGLRILWGPGRGRGVPRWRAAAFGGGLLAIVVALVSPLDAISDVLLSAHMLQHLLLILVAAPLLVLGSPLIPFMLALPTGWRRVLHRWGRARALHATGRAITAPAVSWLLALVVLWAWHAPAPYQAAVENSALHALEHASFLGTSLLFWWTALQPSGRRRLARGADVLYVVLGAMQGGALGALLTFAATPLYPFYSRGVASWGLTPLQDQQLAGLVMWIPFGAVYLGAACALFVGWLREIERETRLSEARTEASRASPEGPRSAAVLP